VLSPHLRFQLYNNFHHHHQQLAGCGSSSVLK